MWCLSDIVSIPLPDCQASVTSFRSHCPTVRPQWHRFDPTARLSGLSDIVSIPLPDCQASVTSFRSHCPTVRPIVAPNFSIPMRSPDQDWYVRAASHYMISVVRRIRLDAICYDGSSQVIVGNDWHRDPCDAPSHTTRLISHDCV